MVLNNCILTEFIIKFRKKDLGSRISFRAKFNSHQIQNFVLFPNNQILGI